MYTILRSFINPEAGILRCDLDENTTHPTQIFILRSQNNPRVVYLPWEAERMHPSMLLIRVFPEIKFADYTSYDGTSVAQLKINGKIFTGSGTRIQAGLPGPVRD